MRDLVIIGAGPAGLSAAVTAASEGMSVTVLDGGTVTGGQAGTSSAIENYPGFSGPVTGADLTGAMTRQALRFGAEFVLPARVAHLEESRRITTDDDRRYNGRAVLLALGVSYRMLSAANLAAYLGRGVSYGSPPLEADRYRYKRVGIVGGANSAGQSALHLAQCLGCRIVLLVRHSLNMSAYLLRRIRAERKIKVLRGVEVTAVHGADTLQGATLSTGRMVRLDYLFVLIGAVPATAWLPAGIRRDERGFILTSNGGDYQTTLPGVYVAGDVHAGSVKRVASAVGAGAQATQQILRERT